MTRTPWSDLSFLDIHTRLSVPIWKGRGMLDYDAAGLSAFAKSYLSERQREAGEEAVHNFVLMVQAFELPGLLTTGFRFGLESEGEDASMCKMIGQLLSPASIESAAGILRQAMTDRAMQQVVVEQGFWSIWLRAALGSSST
jgi:hypothetical protein